MNTVGLRSLYKSIPYKWKVLATVSIGALMTTIDASIVNIALPQIGRYFEARLTAVEWVAAAYVVAVTALLPTLGRLADMRGRKSMYTIGFAIFTIASGLCALAPTLMVLIAARVLQALGGAMMYSNSMAIITEAFPPHERGRAMGVMGAVVSIGLTLGPSLGGFLVGVMSWHAIFTINLPIGAFGVLFAARILKADHVYEEGQRFDAPGALLLLTSLLAFTVALTQAAHWGWETFQTIGLLTLSVASGLVFVWVERRVEQPAVDLSLFRNRMFAASNLSLLISFCATFMGVLLMPFYLQNLLGLSPQTAGLILTTVPMVQFVVGPFAGWLSDRTGPTILTSGGLSLAVIAFGLIAQLRAQSGIADIVFRLGLMGIGFGLFNAPNNSALMGSAPRHRYGVASSLLALMRNLGMAIGLALGGAAFASREALYLDAGLAREDAFVGAFHDAYMIALGLCVIGVLASLVRGNQTSHQSENVETSPTAESPKQP